MDVGSNPTSSKQLSIRGRVVEGTGLIIRLLKKTPLVQTQPDAIAVKKYKLLLDRVMKPKI